MVSYVDRLKTKLAALESSLYRNQQNDRRFNLEVQGIPEQVNKHPTALRNIVVGIFRRLAVECTSDDIQDVYKIFRVAVMSEANDV